MVDRSFVIASERADGECSSRVNAAEEKPLHLVVERLAKPRGIEIIFDKARFRGSQMDVRTGYRTPAGEITLRRVEIETVKGPSRSASEPFLVPFGHIVVRTGNLSHLYS